MPGKMKPLIASPVTGRGGDYSRRKGAGEGGFALVLSLIMLALLTILGAWVFTSSTTELRIAGNTRNTQNAFYAADAGIGYGSNPATLTIAFVASTPVWTSPPVSVGTGSFTTTVRYTGTGALPPGTMSDADVTINPFTGEVAPKFRGLYFTLNSTGGAANNSQVIVEAGVVQVVANSN